MYSLSFLAELPVNTTKIWIDLGLDSQSIPANSLSIATCLYLQQFCPNELLVFS